jgi:hypothetical protein
MGCETLSKPELDCSVRDGPVPDVPHEVQWLPDTTDQCKRIDLVVPTRPQVGEAGFDNAYGGVDLRGGTNVILRSGS